MLGALVELFDAERQIPEFLVIDRRQHVVGVQVAEPDEDVDHLRLELALVERLVPQPQQPQPLERIDRVQCALQRQVRVHRFEHQERLVDHGQALISGEPTRPCGGCSGAPRRPA